MDNEILVALLIKRVEERLLALPENSPIRGPRGQRGVPGVDGKDFRIEEHAETIRSWAKEFALKFEDLTEEQIASLRGAKGRDGKDGKDFSFEENKTNLENICQDVVAGISDSLKLKFSDLSAEEIEQLRGPRGRDGRDGKDGKSFEFEEHRDFFENLKPKFSDFTEQEIDRLRLHFSNLTDLEKDSLKLRFSDLTAEDRLSIRGSRGARGQRGVQGETGKDGKDGKDGKEGRQGVRGLPGIKGVDGRNGRDGQDGKDGEDAPYVTDIRVEQQKKDEAEFVFEFSDGTTITTNAMKLPPPVHYTPAFGGGESAGGGGGGTNGVDGVDGVDGADGASAYDIAVANGFVGTEAQWLASLVGPQGPPGTSTSGTFNADVPAANTVAVDTVSYVDFSAIEYAVALKMGSVRSFLKLVVQKNDSDSVDEWVVWDNIADFDGDPGADVEVMWESAATLDIDIEATVVASDVLLVFKNNEASLVKVSGTRNVIPDFV